MKNLLLLIILYGIPIQLMKSGHLDHINVDRMSYSIVFHIASISSEVYRFGLLLCRNRMKTNPDASASKDDYDLSIINGFQLATAKGSLCEEPLMGVAFIIERWALDTIVNDEQDEQHDTSETNTANPGTTTTIANPIDELESLQETLSINSDESSTVHSQQKPRRIIDPSKVVLKRGPLSGQIVSTMRDACRKAFDSQPRRLVAAMYKCEIIVNG